MLHLQKRYIYALGISLGILGLVVIIASILTFSKDIDEEELLMELLLDTPPKEEKIPETIQEKGIAQNTPKSKVTHKAFNEQVKEYKEEAFKTLEEILEEKATIDEATSSENFLATSESMSLIKQAEKQRKRKSKKTADAVDANEVLQRANTSNKHNATVSYSLVDRFPAKEIPNPVYTCIAGGKVVLNIEVDSNGRIVTVSQNIASSTTTNGCLVDNAIAYAKQTVFTKSDKPKQIGTITYNFQSK